MAKKQKLPPYFVWRDGRPRWVPSPEIRARGFKGQDLKDPSGNWLTLGQAVDAAEALNAKVRAGSAPQTGPAPRTMAALFNALRTSPKFQGQQAGKRSPGERLQLAARTRSEYLIHLRLLEQWCGDVAAEALTPAMIETYYHAMARPAPRGRGLAMANANMRVLKLAMNFAVKKLRWFNFNPVTAVEMAGTEGRRVLFTAEEFNTLIAAADAIGLHSMGDAITLGALTGQRRGDIMTLKEGDLSGDHYTVVQSKRGHTAFVPITAPLRTRIEAMRARKRAAWPGVAHTCELVCTTTGAPYHSRGQVFEKEWRAVRDAAATGRGPDGQAIDIVPQPTLRGKHFSDLRDTAVTWLIMAGCNESEVANISGHSLSTVKMILDKHYFVRNEGLARIAGVKLDAYLKTSKIG